MQDDEKPSPGSLAAAPPRFAQEAVAFLEGVISQIKANQYGEFASFNLFATPQQRFAADIDSTIAGIVNSGVSAEQCSLLVENIAYFMGFELAERPVAPEVSNSPPRLLSEQQHSVETMQKALKELQERLGSTVGDKLRKLPGNS